MRMSGTMGWNKLLKAIKSAAEPGLEVRSSWLTISYTFLRYVETRKQHTHIHTPGTLSQPGASLNGAGVEERNKINKQKKIPPKSLLGLNQPFDIKFTNLSIIMINYAACSGWPSHWIKWISALLWLYMTNPAILECLHLRIKTADSQSPPPMKHKTDF